MANTECSGQQSISQVVFVDCCYKNPCCKDIAINPTAALRPTATAGRYAYTLNLLNLDPGITGIDFDIVSSSVANVGSTCPPGGPTYGYIDSTSPITGLNFQSHSVPAAPYSHIAKWASPGTTGPSNPALQLVLRFPPGAALPCIGYLSFCIQITVRTADCKSCSIMQWFYYKRTGDGKGRETITQINPRDYPLVINNDAEIQK